MVDVTNQSIIFIPLLISFYYCITVGTASNRVAVLNIAITLFASTFGAWLTILPSVRF